MKSTPLQALADDQLARAAHSRNGRAAYTIHGSDNHGLRQRVVALAKGHRFRENGDFGEATLQVLRGRIRLTTTRDTWEGITGDQLTVPPERHSLDVREDSVILLTVLTGQPATALPPVALNGAKVPA